MGHQQMSDGSLTSTIGNPSEGVCRCGCGGILREEKVASTTHYQGVIHHFEMYRYRCSACCHVFLHYDALTENHVNTARTLPWR